MGFIVLGAIVCTVVMIVGIIWLKIDEYGIGAILTISFGIVGVLGFSIGLAFLGWGWKSSEVKATMINREYGTNYTREEVFYAEDVIETIQQIGRTRIEIQSDGTNVVAPVVK